MGASIEGVVLTPVSFGVVEHGTNASSPKSSSGIERVPIASQMGLRRSRPERGLEEPGPCLANPDRHVAELARLLGNIPLRDRVGGPVVGARATCHLASLSASCPRAPTFGGGRSPERSRSQSASPSSTFRLKHYPSTKHQTLTEESALRAELPRSRPVCSDPSISRTRLALRRCSGLHRGPGTQTQSRHSTPSGGQWEPGSAPTEPSSRPVATQSAHLDRYRHAELPHAPEVSEMRVNRCCEGMLTRVPHVVLEAMPANDRPIAG